MSAEIKLTMASTAPVELNATETERESTAKTDPNTADTKLESTNESAGTEIDIDDEADDIEFVMNINEGCINETTTHEVCRPPPPLEDLKINDSLCKQCATAR